MKIISGGRSSNYLARVGIFLIITALITGIPVSYGVAGDDNQPSQNLEIYTWYDLNAVRDNRTGNHTLMNDLNATTPGYTLLAGPTANGGKGWQPIGYSAIAEGVGCQSSPRPIIEYGLDGTFDGQGYEIHDLFINRPDERAVGLFAYLNQNGIIKNVGLVDCNLVASISVGGLVGVNHDTVSKCYSTGNVTGSSSVGGLAGLNGHDVVNSYATGSVTGDEYVGGLVGRNEDGTVSNSFWDTETSGQATSDGGTGKTTAEMQDITTFSIATWDIVGVVNPSIRNTSYIWNIVNNVTCPFLSWQPVS